MSPAVEKFLAFSADALCQRAVGPYLNAPRTQIEVLVREKLIVPLIRAADPTEDFLATFSRRHLDDFLGRLLTDATHRADSLQTIPRAAKLVGCSAANVVRLLLNGKLTRVGRSDGMKGYMSVVVDPAEVEVFLPRPNRDHLSVRDICRTTGWAIT